MLFYSLSSAAERTIADYIRTNVTSSVSASYYTGINNEDKNAPAVVVSARVGHEVYWNTNIYNLSVTVLVKEMAFDTSKEALGHLAGWVFNEFYDPNRNANFTNPSYGFVTFQVQPQDIETEVQEDTLVNKLTLDFIGCLSGANSGSL